MRCSEWLECLSWSYTEVFSSAHHIFYIYHYHPIYTTDEEWPANFFSALWIQILIREDLSKTRASEARLAVYVQFSLNSK